MDNAIVERGMLPGRQDNFRVELHAAFVAVQTASSATFYSDDFSVVLGFRVLLARGWVPVADYFAKACCKTDRLANTTR